MGGKKLYNFSSTKKTVEYELNRIITKFNLSFLIKTMTATQTVNAQAIIKKMLTNSLKIQNLSYVVFFWRVIS